MTNKTIKKNLIIVLALNFIQISNSFQIKLNNDILLHHTTPQMKSTFLSLSMSNEDAKEQDKPTVDPNSVEEYKNVATKFLSNFMGSEMSSSTTKDEPPSPMDSIDFAAPKFKKVDLETLASILDYELCSKEWFVTGNVNPVYFSDDFEFQDPDVKLSGIESYARGVYKLFDQETARAQIISCIKDDEISSNTITVTWRLSGKVNIGPAGLTVKPYIVYTDFTVDETTGLITMQEDRFDIPQWDILLSALFPFLIGTVTAEPAPSVESRILAPPSVLTDDSEAKNDETNPFSKFLSSFRK